MFLSLSWFLHLDVKTGQNGLAQVQTGKKFPGRLVDKKDSKKIACAAMKITHNIPQTMNLLD